MASDRGQGLAQGQGLGPLSALRVTDAVHGIRSGHSEGQSEGSGGDGGGGGATMLFDYWSSIRPTNNSNTISNNTTNNTTTANTTNNTTTSTATDVTTHGQLSSYLSPRLHIIYPQAESSFQLGSNLKDWGNTHFPKVTNNLLTLQPIHLPDILPTLHNPTDCISTLLVLSLIHLCVSTLSLYKHRYINTPIPLTFHHPLSIPYPYPLTFTARPAGVPIPTSLQPSRLSHFQ